MAIYLVSTEHSISEYNDMRDVIDALKRATALYFADDMNNYNKWYEWFEKSLEEKNFYNIAQVYEINADEIVEVTKGNKHMIITHPTSHLHSMAMHKEYSIKRIF